MIGFLRGAVSVFAESLPRRTDRCGALVTFDFGIRNFYVADPEGNLLEIGSMDEVPEDAAGSQK